MKGKIFKKALAASLALLIVSGSVPIKPVSNVFESMVVTAEAVEEVTKTYSLSTYVRADNGLSFSMIDPDDNTSKTVFAADGDTYTHGIRKIGSSSVPQRTIATLQLRDLNGEHDDEDYKWAGITCNGDAKLILEGTNTIKGFYWNYPGVYIAPEKTLTIDGTGSLNTSSIGASSQGACGTVTIAEGANVELY